MFSYQTSFADLQILSRATYGLSPVYFATCQSPKPGEVMTVSEKYRAGGRRAGSFIGNKFAHPHSHFRRQKKTTTRMTIIFTRFQLRLILPLLGALATDSAQSQNVVSYPNFSSRRGPCLYLDHSLVVHMPFSDS